MVFRPDNCTKSGIARADSLRLVLAMIEEGVSNALASIRLHQDRFTEIEYPLRIDIVPLEQLRKTMLSGQWRCRGRADNTRFVARHDQNRIALRRKFIQIVAFIAFAALVKIRKSAKDMDAQLCELIDGLNHGLTMQRFDDQRHRC